MNKLSSREQERVDVLDFGLVSIFVLNYNGLYLLKMILPSLMQTNYPNFEIILIDNGSVDNSIPYVRQNFPSIKIVSIKENRGIGVALNVGLAAASGEFVSFLNNDMEVDPDWLTPLVLAINRYDKIAGCDSKFLDYYERDKIGSAGRFIDRYGNTLLRGIGERDKGQYNHPTKAFFCQSLYKKKLIEEAGKFDETYYIYYEESDLAWRLYRMGYSIIYVPDSKIYHMEGGTIKKPQKIKKKIKDESFYHFYKNKLMIYFKYYSGVRLFSSIIIYFFDLMGEVFMRIFLRQPTKILFAFAGVMWTMMNLRNILKKKNKKINENKDGEYFIAYTGIWKTIFSKMARVQT